MALNNRDDIQRLHSLVASLRDLPKISSLNGATGVVNVAAGAGITLVVSGQTLTLSSPSPAAGLLVEEMGLDAVAATTYSACRVPYSKADGVTSVAYTFLRAEVRAATAPTGGAATVDMQRNGVTILSSVFSIASGAFVATPVTAFATTTCNSDDLITWVFGSNLYGAAGFEIDLLLGQ